MPSSLDAIDGAFEPARHVELPSGPNAIDVALTMPEANGSRVPSGVTRKIETGASCPRDPL